MGRSIFPPKALPQGPARIHLEPLLLARHAFVTSRKTGYHHAMRKQPVSTLLVSGLIVTPPPGLEAGYVPIVTREAAKDPI